MYTLFAIMSLYTSGLSGTVPEDKWVYESIYNPVAETRTYIAKVKSGPSEIELRCSAVSTRAEIRLLLPNTQKTIPASQNVQVQFDNRRPRTVVWRPSINGASLQLPWAQVDWFSRQLSAYNNVQIELAHTDAETTAFSIPLSRSSKAIANLRKRCRFK